MKRIFIAAILGVVLVGCSQRKIEVIATYDDANGKTYEVTAIVTGRGRPGEIRAGIAKELGVPLDSLKILSIRELPTPSQTQ